MDNKSDRRKHHIIYKTTCLVTGKWYVGMHSTNDLNDGYLGSGTHLQRSIKKHGAQNHRFQILEELPSRKELRHREQELLSEEYISDPLCMNIRFSCSPGNDPGFWEKKDHEATRAKLSAASKAWWATIKDDPEKLAEYITNKNNKPGLVEKRAIAIKDKGHKRTPEQLERMKEGQRKAYAAMSSEERIARQQKGTWGRAKTYKVEDTSGNVQLITNIQEFSKNNGIKGTALYKTEARKSFANGFRIIGRM